MHECLLSIKDIGEVIANFLQTEFNDRLREPTSTGTKPFQNKETIGFEFEEWHNNGKDTMGQIPEINQFSFTLMENGLLDFHLHLYHLGLQITVNFILACLYQFLNVCLLESLFKTIAIRYSK